MHENAALLETFYRAFARKDAPAMIACYHQDVRFSDPAFGELDSRHVRGMWSMLCGRAKDLEVEFSGVTADDSTGAAHWEANYTFAATGRKVHNVIDARFEFAGGRIIRHDDTFDMTRWTQMALGPLGYLLGWTSFLKNSVRNKALAQLEAFLAREGGV